MFVERPPDDPDVGYETFERCIVMLHLANMFTIDEALDLSAEMGLNLFVAFGDDREKARRSMEAAQARMLDRFRGEMAAANEPVAVGSADGGRT